MISLGINAENAKILYKNADKYKIKMAYLPEIVTVMRVGGVSNKTIGNRLKANKTDRVAWELNELKPYWFTGWMKPIRKVLQFVNRPK